MTVVTIADKYISRPIRAYRPWLVKSLLGRGDRIAGVMVHATRGGRSAGDDGPGTENWANSRSNRAYDANGDALNYGSFWDELIWEDGTRVFTPGYEHAFPSWCAGYGGAGEGTWAASDYYYQIEVSQGVISDEFTKAEIESLAYRVAELALKHDFPIQRIPFLSQKGRPPPRGICDHEHSANGAKLGKSDPGYKFPWDDFLGLAQELKEGTMLTQKEVRAIVRDEFSSIEQEAGARYDRFVRAMTNRIDAIHQATVPEHRLAEQLKGIHEATDLEVIPGKGMPQ